MISGLLNVGKAAAPKLAAGGLLGLGATASDDAEAGVSGIIRNIPDAIAAINKAVQGGAGQRNPIGVLEKIMHDTNFSNYDEMGEYAIKVDGDTAGDYWKGEIQSMADQLREAGGLTEDADVHVQAWLDDHLGREKGWRAPRPQPNQPRAPKPKAPENNAFGDLKKMMAASAAAGGANAGEAPTMGWGEWPAAPDQPIPTSPEERGFKPWSDYEPQPSYLDRVTDPATYADALRPYVQPIAQGASWLANTPVGQYAGDKFGEAMEEYDSVGGFARGAVRGGYGLFSGESPSEAWDAGVRVSNQTPAESADAVEQWVDSRDWHEEDKGLVGSTLPFMTEYMSNPLDYAGLGLFGKAVKAVR